MSRALKRRALCPEAGFSGRAGGFAAAGAGRAFALAFAVEAFVFTAAFFMGAFFMGAFFAAALAWLAGFFFGATLETVRGKGVAGAFFFVTFFAGAVFFFTAFSAEGRVGLAAFTEDLPAAFVPDTRPPAALRGFAVLFFAFVFAAFALPFSAMAIKPPECDRRGLAFPGFTPFCRPPPNKARPCITPPAKRQTA